MQPISQAKPRRFNMKFFKYGNKGFTLIELLVVIAILGTLAGVVVLNVIQFIGKGACEAALTEMHNMQTASVAYTYSDAGHATFTGTIAAGSTGGVLAPFLLSKPAGTWVFTSGQVTGATYTACATPFPFK